VAGDAAAPAVIAAAAAAVREGAAAAAEQANAAVVDATVQAASAHASPSAEQDNPADEAGAENDPKTSNTAVSLAEPVHSTYLVGLSLQKFAHLLMLLLPTNSLAHSLAH